LECCEIDWEMRQRIYNSQRNQIYRSAELSKPSKKSILPFAQEKSISEKEKEQRDKEMNEEKKNHILRQEYCFERMQLYVGKSDWIVR